MSQELQVTHAERVIGLAATNHGGVVYNTEGGQPISYIGARPFDLSGTHG